MLRVIGPALIDTAVEQHRGAEWHRRRESDRLFRGGCRLSRSASARSLRQESLRRAARHGPGHAHCACQRHRDRNANRSVRSQLRDRDREQGGKTAADATVPVLQPGDPEAETKLEAILKLNPVSRRLEVGTVGTNDVQGTRVRVRHEQGSSGRAVPRELARAADRQSSRSHSRRDRTCPCYTGWRGCRSRRTTLLVAAVTRRLWPVRP